MKIFRNSLVHISALLAFAMSFGVSAEVIFKESFDAQSDWTSTKYSDNKYQAVWFGNVLPDDWDSHYQAGYYNPPSAHDSLEILAENSDKARGGQGKAAVNWREHHINPNFSKEWKSNSALGIHLDKFGGGFEQLYVEFWIAFDPNWTSTTAASKVFRIFSWDEEGDFWQAFEGGSQGPLFLWDYAYDGTYGVRNKLGFRGGPHGENYKMSSSDVSGLPRELLNLGDMSANFTSDLEEGAELTDKVSGSTLQSSGVVSHEQVFGPSGTWTKVAFFVKMNSAPGVQDGVFRQWVDDELILETTQIKWVGENSENKMVKWNAIAIGGNDYWINGGYTNDQQREEWYAIDDLLVSTDIPVNGSYSDSNGSTDTSIPNPPHSVTIEP